MPTDRFSFEGFPPAKTHARKDFFVTLAHQTQTLIFYEAPHRIEASVRDMMVAFGEQRSAVLARELSKTYETFLTGTLADVASQLEFDANQQRGEFVVMVEGWRRQQSDSISTEAEHIMTILLAELPIKKAAALTAKITGDKKNQLYQWALDQVDD